MLITMTNLHRCIYVNKLVENGVVYDLFTSTKVVLNDSIITQFQLVA